MSAFPDFNSYCEAACIKLWGEPNHRSKSELRWNGVDGYSPRTYSFPKKVWYDHGTQRGGSTLELAAFAMGWPKDKPLRGADFYAVWQGAYERGLYPHPPPPRNDGLGDPVAVYDYEDERGQRLFQVLRFEPPGRPKTFRQRTGPDQEKWSIEGVRRVLYKLSELIAEIGEGRVIFVVEGEKDVLTLRQHGIPATTAPMGATTEEKQAEGSGWLPDYSETLRGADVVLCGDNDAPGREHIRIVARCLLGIAARIRILDLAAIWPDIKEGNDISDRFEHGGGTVEVLWAAVEQLDHDQESATGLLAEVHGTFQKWLDDDFDLDVVDAVLATGASDRLSGDPLWLLIVSGPGYGKTETAQSLGGAGAHVTSTIASEGALLSATPRREKSKQATGGLLRKIGDRGLLVLKDVTSILSADRNIRGAVLTALREIHDGKYERNVGTDGGRTLTWLGRITFVGAVTTAWDVAHGVISACGDRFVLIRADSTTGRAEAAHKAIRNTGHEIAMRKELAKTVGKLIANMSKDEYKLSDAETDQLVKIANVVTWARTSVERDYKGDVISAHAPEMPTRFAKQLTQLIRGAVAVGMTNERGMELAIRCARDSIPPLRREILLDIAANPFSQPREVNRRLGRPRMTVQRELEALYMLRLLKCKEIDKEHGGKMRTHAHYSLADNFDRETLLAMTRQDKPARPPEDPPPQDDDDDADDEPAPKPGPARPEPAAAAATREAPVAPIAAWEMDELKKRGFSSNDVFGMSPEWARAILADPECNKLTETYGKGADAPPDTVCRVCKKPGARFFSEPPDPLADNREDYVGGGSYPLHLRCCPRFFKSGMPMED